MEPTATSVFKRERIKKLEVCRLKKRPKRSIVVWQRKSRRLLAFFASYRALIVLPSASVARWLVADKPTTCFKNVVQWMQYFKYVSSNGFPFPVCTHSSSPHAMGDFLTQKRSLSEPTQFEDSNFLNENSSHSF